eukprot:CAMPEP_0194201960 /NCGR_PEP_ID=MMETSP0156-20130528/2105_1 /TAXON_ID=33649 /ORGANISM="Thalassionema nitzschioides, Strain L26-B" /LENGTH=245 /DNA_ID=CAMNT_0038927307 /DNA_START=22 /DNA_END=756 /DNA_ORIENTATION=-
MTNDNNELDPMSIAQQAWMDEKEELTQGFEGKIKSLERTIESMMENHERLIASMAGLMQGQNAELESTSGQSMPSQLDWGEGSEYKPKWEPVVKPPKKKSKSKKNRRIAIKEPESESESESESDDDTATRGDTNTADITFGSGNTANKILQAFKILTRKPKSERDEDSTAENSRSAKSSVSPREERRRRNKGRKNRDRDERRRSNKGHKSRSSKSHSRRQKADHRGYDVSDEVSSRSTRSGRVHW